MQIRSVLICVLSQWNFLNGSNTTADSSQSVHEFRIIAQAFRTHLSSVDKHCEWMNEWMKQFRQKNASFNRMVYYVDEISI